MTNEERINGLYNDIILGAARFAGMTGVDEMDDSEEIMTSKEIVEQKKKVDPDGNLEVPPSDIGIEEEIHFKRYTTRRTHKYTESEMRAIRESCEATIVHDYSEKDIFHMSDEERAEHDMLAEVRLKLGTLRRTYRRVDQYIEAMRVVVQAWEILEKNNFVHSRKEFFKMVSKGKITSASIIMPVFKGIKDYNLDMIIKYISNPDIDASTIAPIKQTDAVDDKWYYRYSEDFDENPEYQAIRQDFYDAWIAEGKTYIAYLSDEEREEKDEAELATIFTDEDLDDAALDELEIRKMHRLLDEDEIEFIHRYGGDSAEKPKMKVHDVERKYTKGYDVRGYMDKKGKKMKKVDRMITQDIHDILNRIQADTSRRNGTAYGRSFIVANGLFDTDKEQHDPWDDVRFRGSWADDDAVYINDLALRETLLRERSGAADSYSTYADLELMKFFEAAERAGINVVELRRKMNMTEEDIKNTTTARERKANRKVEAALVKRITRLNKDPKFKKVIAKAEKEVNEHYDDY